MENTSTFLVLLLKQCWPVHRINGTNIRPLENQFSTRSIIGPGRKYFGTYLMNNEHVPEAPRRG